MATTAEKYICPICKRAYRLNQNGTLRQHWKRDGMGRGLPFSDPCEGSHGQPGRKQQ